MEDHPDIQLGGKVEREAMERYVQGYREQPETEGEVAEAHRAAYPVLAEEPWE